MEPEKIIEEIIEKSRPLYGEPVKEACLTVIVDKGRVDSADMLERLVDVIEPDDERGFGLASLALDDLVKEGLVEWSDTDEAYVPTEEGKEKAKMDKETIEPPPEFEEAFPATEIFRTVRRARDFVAERVPEVGFQSPIKDKRSLGG